MKKWPDLASYYEDNGYPTFKCPVCEKITDVDNSQYDSINDVRVCNGCIKEYIDALTDSDVIRTEFIEKENVSFASDEALEAYIEENEEELKAFILDNLSY